MVLRKYLDDFIKKINEKISEEGKHGLCQLHETVAPYHYTIGYIKGLTEAAKFSEQLWNDYLSPDKNYADRLERK